MPRIAACIIGISVFLSGGMAVASDIPLYDHVVIVVMENTSYTSIIGDADAPYINALAAMGANFTQYYAVTHPSQPNYIALFSGSTQGVIGDNCPVDFPGVDNLGAQLIAAGLSFTGYSEDLPSAGSTVCTAGLYARKHNPWVDFNTVPAASNQPFTAFPTDYSTLPTLSFAIPNLCNDMHNCPVATGDAWLASHIDGYVQWALTHNSLFILTWDEDDYSGNNMIATLFVGQGVIPGNYGETTGHYRTLATLEAMYGLPQLGAAIGLPPVTDIWTGIIFANGFD